MLSLWPLWVLSHRLKCASATSKPSPAFPLLSLLDCCHPPFCAHCPHVVTYSVLLTLLPAGPIGLCAPSCCSPHPNPLAPAQHSGPPLSVGLSMLLSVPSLLPCVPPTQAQPFSWSQGVLCLLLLSPGALSLRGLLHQSPQSKINEEKPNSQVHGLKKKSNKKGEKE